jgi:hypothetical protein
MFRRLIAVVLITAAAALAAGTTAGGATAGPLSPMGRQPRLVPSSEPGQTRDNPYLSPRGLRLRGTGGFDAVIVAIPAFGGEHAEARVEIGDSEGIVKYTVPANLAGEGIHANFGRYGRIDLRWVPNGGVRAVPSNCEGFRTRYFFSTGSYVGSVRFRGGRRFTKITARRVAWRRSWYPKDYECPLRVSEGQPGPGTILDAEGWVKRTRPIRIDAIQERAGARVQYQAAQFEQAGRMAIARYAFAFAGPKTLSVSSDFSTGEISPPAPFSGTGRFERTERARGTWRGDLSVEFIDHTTTRLDGGSFEAVLHSGYYEQHRRAR